jgi:sigma-B regulation protein RsbU (phosphoserine phosphatase)
MLYTDGVVEAMNPKQDEYGQQRFHDIILRYRTEHPKTIIENLLSDIEKFTAGHPQHDDITVVALRVVGSDASLKPIPHAIEAPAGT